MKICHLTSVHGPFDIRIFHKECKCLAAAGHEVHLIAPHDRDETVDGIRIHPVPVFPDKVSRIIKSPVSVYHMSVGESCDVYHFHDPELIPLGLLLKSKGKKVIYDAHEDYPVYFRYKEAFPSPLRRPISLGISVLERFSAPRFDAVVTVTPTIYRRFSELNDATVLVCNFPFPEDAVQTCDSETGKEDAVVYVGSLTPDRGVREMAKGVEIACKRRPVKLLLGGYSGNPRDGEMIRRLSELPYVDYRGQTTRNETLNLYSRAKAGLVLLHPLANYVVAYPTKMFEYMASGLPVIASDFPLYREIVDEIGCGLCVDPMNTEAVADAITKLMENPELARDMGRKGKEAIRNTYNWNHEKRKLIELYENLR